ncbi:MAG: LacI family transcriptional regulator [Candidatus Moduliflexus flocculans]|nr:LacI family transcriptional regulator [Candidatus Moduliflexus flocculans]
MKRAITLRDIGKQLGLSAMTVSLALRDSPRISDADQEARAAQPCAGMNFVPNQLARALATGRSNLIGVIVPNSSDLYYAEVIRAIEDSASAAAVPRDAVQRLLPDGDLHGPRPRHAAPAHEGHHRRAALHGGAAPAPAVLEGPRPQRFRSGAHQPPARPADLPPGGGRLHGGRRHGGRRRWPSAGTGAWPTSRARRRCCPSGSASTCSGAASRSYGFDGDDALLERGELTCAGGYEACRRLWKANRRKPTAVVASNDTSAVGVLRYLDEVGVSVPQRRVDRELRRHAVRGLRAPQPDDGGDADVRDRPPGVPDAASRRCRAACASPAA